MYNTAGDGNINTIIGSITSQVRNYGTGIATASFASIQFATDPVTWYRGNIRFLTNGTDGTSGAGTEQMRITSNGNVGIGTITPSAVLDVVGTGKFTTAVSKTQLTVNGTGAIQSGINFANGGTIYGEIYFDNNAPYDMSIYQKYTTGSLILGTNTTERMRITSAGNVGIGTTAPIYPLQVGTSGAEVSIGGAPTANGTGRLKFINTNSTKNWQISTNDSVAGAFEIMPSTTNGGSTFTTPAMLISSTGNVSTPTQTTAMGGLDAVFNMPLAYTYYTMPFKTTAGPFNINIGSNWNNGTYTYTAPITGIYLICVGIYTDTVDRLGVFINGNRKINITGYPSIAGADIWTSSCMVSMTETDTLQFRSYSESVGAVIQYDAAYTFFQLRLLG